MKQEIPTMKPLSRYLHLYRLGILHTHDVIGKLLLRYEHCYPFISNSTSMAAFDCFSVLWTRSMAERSAWVGTSSPSLTVFSISRVSISPSIESRISRKSSAVMRGMATFESATDTWLHLGQVALCAAKMRKRTTNSRSNNRGS